MKLSMSLILFSIIIVVFVELNKAHYLGPLIKNINDKYKTAGVIIFSDRNYPCNYPKVIDFQKTLYYELIWKLITAFEKIIMIQHC